jgi:hypothetical protein
MPYSVHAESVVKQPSQNFHRTVTRLRSGMVSEENENGPLLRITEF